MSSTNKTTNYELSQFLGTDKPAWLSDYNTDMGKIDAQMKFNADCVTTASGAASAASAAVGTLANLTTDAKTSLVAAVNEVDSHADTAASTASSALSGATTANNGVTALNNYLNLSVNNSYTGSQLTLISGSGTPYASDQIYVARNADGTLGKIYGTFLVNNAGSAGRTRFKLNLDTGLAPEDTIDIVGTGVYQDTTGGVMGNANLRLNTDGTIEIEGYHGTNQFYVRLFACLIFVKNLGDQPE